MTYQPISSCPVCGAVIWTPTIWHGVYPPPPHYTCQCVQGKTKPRVHPLVRPGSPPFPMDSPPTPGRMSNPVLTPDDVLHAADIARRAREKELEFRIQELEQQLQRAVTPGGCASLKARPAGSEVVLPEFECDIEELNKALESNDADVSDAGGDDDTGPRDFVELVRNLRMMMRNLQEEVQGLRARIRRSEKTGSTKRGKPGTAKARVLVD